MEFKVGDWVQLNNHCAMPEDVGLPNTAKGGVAYIGVVVAINPVKINWLCGALNRASEHPACWELLARAEVP